MRPIHCTQMERVSKVVPAIYILVPLPTDCSLQSRAKWTLLHLGFEPTITDLGDAILPYSAGHVKSDCINVSDQLIDTDCTTNLNKLEKVSPDLRKTWKN